MNTDLSSSRSNNARRYSINFNQIRNLSLRLKLLLLAISSYIESIQYKCTKQQKHVSNVDNSEEEDDGVFVCEHLLQRQRANGYGGWHSTDV